MKKILVVLILVVLAGFFIFSEPDDLKNFDTEDNKEVLNTEVFLEKEMEERVEKFPIESGDTFTIVMERMGFEYSDALAIVDVASTTYDFTKIKAGKNFRKIFVDEVFDRLEYDIDIEEFVTISKNENVWSVTRQDISYEVEAVSVKGVIESSLFLAGNEIGLDDATILDLADVFAWEIDFATVIQKGDSFSLMYEKRSRDGEVGPSGKILAATFTNVGKEFTALRFEDPDGGVGYYNTDGESLIRPFLKAPLRYSRISSGYTNARFHPVTKTTSPHLAIDYAAPIGTPILSTASGIVKFAGWNGGYGKLITIHHNDTWRTNYAHLSAFAKNITFGTRVEQGDVIGYVGSTGWSTGPHLHYEMIKNGSKVNPLTVELPAGDPVKDEWRISFDNEKYKFKDFFGGD